jgi:Cof subfamily protein (haloacid dehalogenase superfamily)
MDTTEQHRHSGVVLLVTDLDGTLLGNDGQLSTANRLALETLGSNGVRRVIATGRSLFSARKVIDEHWPIDTLVFSSGAGVIDWPTQELTSAFSLDAKQIERAAAVFDELGLSFMVHECIPQNHRFWFRRSVSSEANLDFSRRIALYEQHSQELESLPTKATQLLAVVPPNGVTGITGIKVLELVRQRLPELNVIRATSPLDHHSIWIEVFPATVSKSQAAERLRVQQGVPLSRTVAIGNDHNDVDLLHWAGSSFVVGNAPADLQAQFEVVPTNVNDGFAVATQLASTRLSSN